METNQDKLEKLCDIMTEDIFNDIEFAKSVIDEAGYDHNISVIEGRKKIEEIKDLALFRIRAKMILDIYNFEDKLKEVYNDNLNCTAFNQRNPIPFANGIYFQMGNLSISVNAYDNNVSNLNSVNEEKLQLN